MSQVSNRILLPSLILVERGSCRFQKTPTPPTLDLIIVRIITFLRIPVHSVSINMKTRKGCLENIGLGHRVKEDGWTSFLASVCLQNVLKQIRLLRPVSKELGGAHKSSPQAEALLMVGGPMPMGSANWNLGH